TIALHETDLCIDAGRTTVLIGPSGCGKSTILRLIIGLLEPTTGTIRIEGQPVSASNVLALRRRIGYVIQEGGLFAHLTAAQDELKEIFERLRQTIVLVTHDMTEAGFFANLIVLLNEGRVVQFGTLDDLRSRPASTFVRDFLHAQRGLAAI